MMTFQIPALTMENEFTNMDFVTKYADGLYRDTKDDSYRIIYCWGGDEAEGPPQFVLVRNKTWQMKLPRIEYCECGCGAYDVVGVQ